MLNEAIVSEIATKLGMPEVLEQFLHADTPAAGVNPFAEKLGLVEAFTSEQLTTRLTNERQIAATEAAKAATGNTYGAIDTRTLKATGIAKNQGETTVDYTERAFKEKFGTAAPEGDELKRLRADLVAKDALLATNATRLTEMEAGFATERKQATINGKLDARINLLNIDVPASVPADNRQAYIDNQREFVKYKLMQAHDVDVVDGKTQFTDKATGQVVRDVKTAAPITEAALIDQFAPKVVSLKKTSAAQGSGFDSSRTTPTGDGGAAFDFALYATRAEFATALNKAGIGSGTPEGGKLYEDFKKARPDAK
jgi:hypothetical protein